MDATVLEPTSDQASNPQMDAIHDTAPKSEAQSTDAPECDTSDVPLRPQEKKRLHWSGNTCKFALVLLALICLTAEFPPRPRTAYYCRQPGVSRATNAERMLIAAQPFRLLCVDFGADITCGESTVFAPLSLFRSYNPP